MRPAFSLTGSEYARKSAKAAARVEGDHERSPARGQAVFSGTAVASTPIADNGGGESARRAAGWLADVLEEGRVDRWPWACDLVLQADARIQPREQ